MYYQPIVELASRRLVGFEALVRWQSPEGLVLPGRFIKIAEETGEIIPLGRFVLNQACEDLARWRKQEPLLADCSVSVNVSKIQLHSKDFVSDVLATIERHGLEPKDIKIEVTESTFMESLDICRRYLIELAEAGLKIHMDDFGTGYSSLSCLHQFPISVVKIDRSFVATMDSDQDYASIVQAIVILAHNLDSQVTAEGIETQEQFDMLHQLGCDFGQGYHIARPGPAERVRIC